MKRFHRWRLNFQAGPYTGNLASVDRRKPMEERDEPRMETCPRPCGRYQVVGSLAFQPPDERAGHQRNSAAQPAAAQCLYSHEVPPFHLATGGLR